MFDLVIAFPRMEDAKRIRDVLQRHGYAAENVFSTAAAALSCMNRLTGGILICGFRLPDMHFAELRECLPPGFRMLLAASSRALSTVEGIDVPILEMPFTAGALIDAVQDIIREMRREAEASRDDPPRRSLYEQKRIKSAKALLMEKKHMSEEEAHRYLQKCSMDTGRSMAETAGLILTLMSG